MKKIVFIFSLLLPAFGYTAPTCESLFGDYALYRSIRALAELRLELDLAQTSNDDSLTISLLKTEYEHKEKALLKYVLQTHTMTKENFMERIKLEISNLQKSNLEKSKDLTRKRKQMEDAIDESIQAKFHRCYPNPRILKEHFEMMKTPVTRGLWQKTLALKSPASLKLLDGVTDLFPITKVSFREVQKWLDDLNSLSREGNTNLERIFNDHKPGDIYKLPSLDQLRNFLKMTELPEGENPQGFAARSNEAVTARKPFTIQGHEYFGLAGGLSYFLSDFHETDSLSTLGANYFLRSNANTKTSFEDGTWDPDSKKGDSVTFRLIRERGQP